MFRKKDTTLSEASARQASPNGRTKVLPPVPPRPAPIKSGPAPLPAAKALQAGSKGKQAYEARRAEKAGMGLEKWMAEKDRRVQAEREAVQRARRKAEPEKRSLLRRLLDKAHRPI